MTLIDSDDRTRPARVRRHQEPRREVARPQREEILAEPRLRHALHRPHGRHLLVGARRLAPAARAAVRPDLARPRRRRAALRAGDLRGHQGLPPRGRLDPHLPPRPERAPAAALGAPPGAARAAGRVLPPVAPRARRRRRRLGALRRRPEPVPAAVHVRQGGVPRRAPGRRRSPTTSSRARRAPTSRAASSPSRSGSARTTRAPARAARVRRRPAATTPRACCRSPRRTSNGCDQVVFLDQDRNVEELGGMNVVFVYKDGTLVTPQSDVDPRGHHARLDPPARRRPRAQGRAARRLARRVARGCGLRRHRRGVRVRHRRRRDADRRAQGRGLHRRAAAPASSRCRCARSSPTSSTAAAEDKHGWLARACDALRLTVKIARFSHHDAIRFGIVDDDRPRRARRRPDVRGLRARPASACRSREVALLAPVIPRSKVVCVGANYRDHAAETRQRGARRADALPQAEHLGDRTRRRDRAARRSPSASTSRASSPPSSAAIAKNVSRRGCARLRLRLHDRQRCHGARSAEDRRPVGAREGLRHVLPARSRDRDRVRSRRRRADRRRASTARCARTGRSATWSTRSPTSSRTRRRPSRCCPATSS